MLSALSIRNIVLIDQLDLGLDEGLTVLTGETGAGKSILLDALTLALGGRGDSALVRAGQDSGQVVAVLQLPSGHPARMLLRDNAVAYDDELILRRVQYADGKTRAFVNDQPVSAGLLQQLGRLAIEIHGQHDDRALVDPASHRALLDAFGGHESLADAVRDAHAALASANEALAEQRAMIAEATTREEFARHVVEELETLGPVPGEETELADRRQRLMQLEKSASEVGDIEEALNGPTAPSPVLAQLVRRFSRKADSGATIFAALLDTLDAALVALDRSADALEDLKRDMAFDPGELERVEERLFALRGLARKHQTTPDGLCDVLARYSADLAALESGAGRLVELEAAAKAALASYATIAERLSAARKKSATALRKAVEAELPDLKLKSSKFIIVQEADPARIGPSGFDQIAFHVQTNPGTPAGPMLKIASGGELSRFLLALKVALADRGSAPVLIFDEIDTGVGGAVADAIGRRLSRLAQRVQVLAVTHAPQVAARARSHLLIEKQAVGSAFVRTSVKPLDGANRREEIARMLAGARITEEARAAAGRLMSEVA